jgi:transcriptional regulator with GAF, ATPase, and Fis domain
MPGTYTLSLVAQSPIMRSVLAQVDTIAASESSLLLIGETGVGKELIAEYTHRSSPRRDRPLVKVGLAALPPELLESELFGHERGAYTSASSEKKGLFEMAETGTIFLDDIDDFPLVLQSKLLRVLDAGEILRVGGTRPIPIDVRLVTATKVDLKNLVDRGLFRSDLYYRINVVPISIPPLRERREDIPQMVAHFLRRYVPNREVRVRDDAMRMLQEYAWPGNVRELRNVVQRIALFANDEICPTDLPVEIRHDTPVNLFVKACSRCFADDGMSFEQVITCLEMNLLQQAMQQTRGNRSHAARLLGMNLSTFRDKLKKHSLDDARPDSSSG